MQDVICDYRCERTRVCEGCNSEMFQEVPFCYGCAEVSQQTQAAVNMTWWDNGTCQAHTMDFVCSWLSLESSDEEEHWCLKRHESADAKCATIWTNSHHIQPSSINGMCPGEVKGATTECFQVEVQGIMGGDNMGEQHFLLFQSSLVITVGDYGSFASKPPEAAKLKGALGHIEWVSQMDERASTFAREESKLCSFICPQLELGNFCYLAAKASVEDANFALLFYQPYQFISVPHLKLRSKAPQTTGATFHHYSCSRQADVQEAVRAAQMPTTGNALAIQNLSKSLRFQLIGVRVRQQCLTHRA